MFDTENLYVFHLHTFHQLILVTWVQRLNDMIAYKIMKWSLALEDLVLFIT